MCLLQWDKWKLFYKNKCFGALPPPDQWGEATCPTSIELDQNEIKVAGEAQTCLKLLLHPYIFFLVDLVLLFCWLHAMRCVQRGVEDDFLPIYSEPFDPWGEGGIGWWIWALLCISNKCNLHNWPCLVLTSVRNGNGKELRKWEARHLVRFLLLDCNTSQTAVKSSSTAGAS